MDKTYCGNNLTLGVCGLKISHVSLSTSNIVAEAAEGGRGLLETSVRKVFSELNRSFVDGTL